VHTKESGGSRLIKACDKTTGNKGVAMNQENEIQRQIQNLESGDLREKLRAVIVLRQHRTECRVTEAFIKALGDSQQVVRREAAWALDTPEVAGMDVVRALAERLLEDPEPHVRAAAADALGHIGPDAKDALPMLIRALERDESGDVLHNVAVALECIGPGAKAAVPALEERARENDDIAEKCRQALHNILGPA